MLNLVFSTGYFLFIDESGSWTLRFVNVAIVAGYLIAVAAVRTGRVDAAMWLVNSTGLVNIALSSTVQGLDLGSLAFFVVVPLAATLMAREGDTRVPLIVAGGAIVAIGVIVAIEPEVPAAVAGGPWQSVVRTGNVASVVVFAAIVTGHYRRRVERAERELSEAHARSENLLLNILPAETAERLKSGEHPIADSAEDVSIVFADLVGSTPLIETLTPDDLVDVLDRLFSAFDDLADHHGLEKIKTVGDAYIAVAGLPTPRPDYVEAAANMALAMRDEVQHHITPNGLPLRVRIGLHCGPVVAGVIGRRKFSYDLWGHTVNLASRMESQGIADHIQVTDAVRTRLDSSYLFEERGAIDVKGKGPMRTYLLLGRAGTSAG